MYYKLGRQHNAIELITLLYTKLVFLRCSNMVLCDFWVYLVQFAEIYMYMPSNSKI